MIELANGELVVTVLDANRDRELLGARYCAGGYIFQIEDADLGPLMSGPTYPEAFDWFNGQGIPDSFAATPLHPRRADDPSVLVLGVGLCTRDLSSVLRFDDWSVDAQSAHALVCSVTHRLEHIEVRIRRAVTLVGRTVVSSTTVSNLSDDQFAFSWFPHPFFPYPRSAELVRFSTPVSVPEGGVFESSTNGFISRRSAVPPEGEYAALSHRSGRGLNVIQRHPRLGLVAAELDFSPTLLPIWGNDRAFSWEPHHDRSLAAGESASWSVSYHF